MVKNMSKYTKVCESCGYEERYDTKICSKCGTNLFEKSICGGCGEENDPITKCCSKCGLVDLPLNQEEINQVMKHQFFESLQKIERQKDRKIEQIAKQRKEIEEKNEKNEKNKAKGEVDYCCVALILILMFAFLIFSVRTKIIVF